MLIEPHVRVLARELRSAIDRAAAKEGEEASCRRAT
jgi:hypothetical protein